MNIDLKKVYTEFGIVWDVENVIIREYNHCFLEKIPSNFIISKEKAETLLRSKAKSIAIYGSIKYNLSEKRLSFEDINNIIKDISKFKTKESPSNELISLYRKRDEKLKEKLTSYKRRLNRKETDLAEYRKEIAISKEEIQELTDLIQHMEDKKYKKLGSVYEDFTDRIDLLNSRIERLNTQILVLMVDIPSIHAKIEGLSNVK